MTKYRDDIEALIGAPAPKAKPGRKPGDGGKPSTATRDRLNLAQAKLAETRNAKLRGELIERERALALWASIVADLRVGLMAAPARIGAKLSLAPEVVDALDAEIRELLTTLADAEGLPRV